MRLRTNVLRTLIVTFVTGFLVFSGSIGAASAAVDGCITAEIPETFVLPGGEEFAPATLTLCRDRQFSPARALLVGYVDRAAVSMLYAIPEAGDIGEESESFVLFVRDEDGKLHLRGYAVSGGDGVDAYAIEGLGRERIRVLTRAAQSPRSDEDASLVLVPVRSLG